MASFSFSSFVDYIKEANKYDANKLDCIISAAELLSTAPNKRGENKEMRHSRLIKSAYAALKEAGVDGDSQEQYVRGLLWGFMCKDHPICTDRKGALSPMLPNETRADYFRRMKIGVLNLNAAMFRAKATGTKTGTKTGGNKGNRAGTAPKVQGGQTGNVAQGTVNKTPPKPDNSAGAASVDLHASEAEIGKRIDGWLADSVEAERFILALLNRAPALAKAGIKVAKPAKRKPKAKAEPAKAAAAG